MMTVTSDGGDTSQPRFYPCKFSLQMSSCGADGVRGWGSLPLSPFLLPPTPKRTLRGGPPPSSTGYHVLGEHI